jgi:hypothetical protein
MPYMARNPQGYGGKAVGTGQCVAFVQAATRAPNTGVWKPGSPDRGFGSLGLWCSL